MTMRYINAILTYLLKKQSFQLVPKRVDGRHCQAVRHHINKKLLNNRKCLATDS